MDTVAAVTVYGKSDNVKSAVAETVEELYRLEKIFSYTDTESELSRINAAAYGEEVKVSEDMARVIDLGLRYSELTGGAFDISLGKLIDDTFDGDLFDLGYEYISFCSRTMLVGFANESVKMHFGAIAKGYALDRILHDILAKHDIEAAIIDIGGEVGVFGDSPHKDGLWRIGIQDPLSKGEIAKTMNVLGWNTTVATSGTYERGEHILDRTTGLAAESEYSSVTVIAGGGLDDGARADALSTAIFVAGEAGIGFIKDWELICVVTIDKTGKTADYHFGGFDYCMCGGLADGTPAD